MAGMTQRITSQAKSLLSLFRETIEAWQRDRATRLAAALSYYALLTMPPLLAIAVFIVGQIFGPREVLDRLTVQLTLALGPDIADFLRGIIQNAYEQPTTPLGAIIGLGGLLLGASGFFLQLQGALNTMWGVQPDPEDGLMHLIMNRLLSFGMVLLISGLLLAMIVFNTLIGTLGERVRRLIPLPAGFTVFGQYVVGFALFVLLIALIYKIVPDVRIAWRDVLVGSLVTTILFLIGQLALTVYLSQTDVASVYGAAGTIVVLLVWTYYTAQIVFLGAEFTQVYARRHGEPIEPAADARPLQPPGVPSDEVDKETEKKADRDEDGGDNDDDDGPDDAEDDLVVRVRW